MTGTAGDTVPAYYEITFERVGRQRNVAPLRVTADHTTDELSYQILQHVQPRLTSDDVDVLTDLRDMNGRLLVGGRNAGTFTITLVTPTGRDTEPVTAGNNDHAATDHAAYLAQLKHRIVEVSEHLLLLLPYTDILEKAATDLVQTNRGLGLPGELTSHDVSDLMAHVLRAGNEVRAAQRLIEDAVTDIHHAIDQEENPQP